MSRFLRYIKRKKLFMGALALLLTVSVVLPLALLSGGALKPTLAAPGDPIIGKPGVPIDAAAVDYEIRRYQQYNDSAWTTYNGTRGTSPTGRFPAGTSGYFNMPNPTLPVSSSNTNTGPKTRDHVLFFPRVMDMTNPWNPTVVSPSVIRFGGYNYPCWFDYVYTEQLQIETIEFDIKPQVWDFHTMHRTGFFFKCKRTPTPLAPVDKNGNGVHDYDANTKANSDYDTSNAEITGYVFSIGDTAHSNLTAATNVNFELYYVQNMNIDRATAWMEGDTPLRLTTGQTNFTNGAQSGVSSTTAYTNQATTYINTYCLGSGRFEIPLSVGAPAPQKITRANNPANLVASTPQMHIMIESTPTAFQIYYTPNSASMTPAQIKANRVLLFNENYSSRVTGEGFGLYMQNNAHNCGQLTVTEFQDFTVTQANEPTPVRPQLDFVDVSTGLPIRGTYTYHSDLWSTDTFDVEPPPSIVSTSPFSTPDKTYYYFRSDRDGRTYSSTGGSGLIDIPVDANNNTNNHTTLYYVLAPTMRKDARVLPDTVIHNGNASKPYVFDESARLQYTITLTNPNTVALNKPFVVQDSIPAGLTYVSHTQSAGVPAGVRDVFGGLDRITWTPTSLPAGGSLTFTIVTEVAIPGKVFDNWAILTPPADTGLEVTSSNHTYHKSTPRPVTGKKDAQVANGSGGWQGINNGSSGSPVTFGRGDQIKYTITAQNPNAPQQVNKYDVVYVVDWSGSMGTSRNTARFVSEELADMIIDTYPGSRVAFQGINLIDAGVDTKLGSASNLSGGPMNVYVQADTPFVDTHADYLSQCGNAYTLNPRWNQDDCALFFRAAFEKLYGPIPGNAGFNPNATLGPDPANNLTVWGQTLVPGGAYPPSGNTISARTDKSRIPLIVIVSDWQLSSGSGPITPWDRMRDVSQQFRNLCPTGIVIPVYMNGGGSNHVTNLNYICSTIGEDEWGWVDVVGNTNTQAATKVMNVIRDLAPLTEYSGGVKDTLPKGLKVVSTNPAADRITQNPVTGEWTVEWDHDVFPDGNNTYEIVTEVDTAELTTEFFNNKAVISTEFQTDEETNTTYHRLPKYNVTVTWQELKTAMPASNGLGTTDRIDQVISGNSYTLKPTDTNTITHGGKTFVYYGYSIDGGTTVIPGTPPAPIINRVNGNMNVVLYFRTTYTVTEKFHWWNNATSSFVEVWSDLSPHTVNSGDNWTPSANHGTLPGIGIGPFSTPQSRWIAGYEYTWIANQYKQETDTAAQTAWTTGYTNIQANHTVIYPYNRGPYTEFQVTEEFRKIEDTAQLISADTITSVPGGNNFSTAVTNFNSKVTSPNELYVYVGYQIDGGTIFFDNIPAPALTYVTANHKITYLYAVLASKNARVYHGGANPPDALDPGTLMVPVIARPGDPTIPTADDEIEYFINLDIPAGMQNSRYTVTVSDELPKGLQYISSDPATPDSIVTNPSTQRTTVTWTVLSDRTTPITVRVKVVDRPPPASAFVNQALVTLNNRPHIPQFSTNPTFHSNIMPGDRMLHIRQIILPRSPSSSFSVLPPAGFFEMRNDGHLTDLLSTSGLLGTIVPFTIYTLPDTIDPAYLLKDIVPQFYEWKDYELTHDPLVPHDRTPGRLRTNRSISISYLDEREYWLTVYLTPRTLTGQHSWDFRTNHVGPINRVIAVY